MLFINYLFIYLQIFIYTHAGGLTDEAKFLILVEDQVNQKHSMHVHMEHISICLLRVLCSRILVLLITLSYSMVGCMRPAFPWRTLGVRFVGHFVQTWPDSECSHTVQYLDCSDLN